MTPTSGLAATDRANYVSLPGADSQAIIDLTCGTCGFRRVVTEITWRGLTAEERQRISENCPRCKDRQRNS